MMTVSHQRPFHSFRTSSHDSPSAKAKKVGTYKVITYKSYLESLASLPGYENPSIEPVIKGEPFIHKLPVELLAEIFEMAIVRIPLSPGGRQWESRLHYVTFRWGRKEAPFNLLQVCSSWRTIVQATSSIWNTLSGLQFHESRPAVPEMQYWLRNSGSAPLRLHLECVPQPSYVYRDPLLPHKLLGLFATQAHRWESLALSLTPSLAEEFTSILQSNYLEHGFPFLEQLEIFLDLPHSFDRHAIERLATAIASVQTLRRIYWNVDADFDGYLNLPWNQLDVIHIVMPHSTESAIAWISQCSVASRITLHDLRTRDTNKNIPSSKASFLRLPRLKHLDLEGLPAVDLLSRLVVPNLETLHVKTRSKDANAYCTLEAMLDRSQCLLKEIIISESCFPTMISDLALHFLGIAPLHAVPTVEITHRAMHTSLYHRLQIQPFPGHSKLPPLLAWTSSRPFSNPGIGWKHLEPDDEKGFAWDNGKIETFCDPLLLIARN